jgi:hypothetical protein
VITADDIVWETGPELLNPSRAAFDFPDRVYRYQLTRTWNPAWPSITWIMLNPSTADAFTDDATIAKIVKSFARPWAAGGITVVNLFAWRATDPAGLRTAGDPVGARNDEFIADVCQPGGIVIAAWGAHGSLGGRGPAVARALAARGVELRCLGLTYGGHPRHPLYVSRRTPLQPYQETR